MSRAATVAFLLALASWAGAPLAGRSQAWPFEVTDLSARDRLVILVFGDGGTGVAGQGRVGHAMAITCRDRGCDLAIMLGDNLYEDASRCGFGTTPRRATGRSSTSSS